MGLIFKGQESKRNCHYSLHNNPEERSSHLLRDGSLKSRIWNLFASVSWQVTEL